MRRAALLAALLAGCATTSSAPPVEAPLDEPEDDLPPEPSATEVVYRGRVIDVGPHVAGYPYRTFRPMPALGRLLYLHEGEQRTLRSVPLDGDLDGVAVADMGARDLRTFFARPTFPD